MMYYLIVKIEEVRMHERVLVYQSLVRVTFDPIIVPGNDAIYKRGCWLNKLKQSEIPKWLIAGRRLHVDERCTRDLHASIQIMHERSPMHCSKNARQVYH